MIEGKNNKRISQELEICIQTAAKHTSRVLEKVGVENAVELTRLILDVRPTRSPNVVELANARKPWVIAH